MAKQDIKLGVEPTGKGGDSNRRGNIKINANFTELYKAMGAVFGEVNSGVEGAVLPLYLPTTHGGTGNGIGNAPTADKFYTARNISISGGVTGTATSFDGSEDISIDVTSIDASKILAGTIPAERVPILNQDTTGNASTANNAQHAVEADHAKGADHAGTADSLKTSVKIHGVDFDGSGAIDIPTFNREKDGTVPHPTTTTSTRYLREDGTWEIPTNTTYTLMSDTEYKAATSLTGRLISAKLLKAAVLLHGKELESIQGNAATASKLKDPVNINGKPFDGSESIEILTGSSAYIGSVSWFNGNPMRLPDGYVQGNGQIYNRADYPFMWEAIERGQFEAIDDATWLADPSQRAKYSLGDGSTTFRMPDLNGVQPDSLNAPFLRGKGPFAVGTVLGDAIRDIQGYAFDIVGGNDALAQGAHGALVRNHIGAWQGLVADNSSTRILNFGGYSFKASNVVPTANENRPISAVGMWIIKVRGDTVASPESQPATLLHNEFHGNQIIHGDMIVTGEVRFGEGSKVEVNLPIGFVEWYNGPRTHIRMGTLPGDGQLLNRADYPALWAEIARGAFVAVTEADWWATPNNRGSYSLGDGATTFRMPDLNGVQAGSYKRTFLRGADTNAFVGQMRGDAIREIEGGFAVPVPGGHGDYRKGVFDAANGVDTSQPNAGTAVYGAGYGTDNFSDQSKYGYKFKASLVVPTAEEVRPVNAMGVWVIRVSGGVPNNTTGTAAGIDTNTFNGHQTMNAGASIIGDLLLNGLNLGTAFSGGSTGDSFRFTIPRKEDPSRPWIVQIGTHVQTVTGGASNAYTLPVSYPTIGPQALVTTGDLAASGGHIIGLLTTTKNQIMWMCTGTAHVRMNYIAVGY